MSRLLKKAKHEIGISPDDLIFRGKKKVQDILLRVIDYDANNFSEETINSISDFARYQSKDSVTWLNIDGLHNTEIMNTIASEFNFDRLILADVMNTQARATIKEYENCLYISVKMLQLNQISERLNVENLSFIITPSFLISFQEKTDADFDTVRERIRKQKKRIRNGGTDYLLFALLDIVIDNYIHILSLLGEKIEMLEENLLLDPTHEVIDTINLHKHELNFLRKNIIPTKEIILNLSKLDSDLIHENNEMHFKELQDNINQANESSDSYREILSDQLHIYHTTISSKLNDTMKVLTIFSVIFIPLTFIAGVYGTNFKYFPELDYKYSYFIMWAFIILIATGMLIYFKRKKWF